MAMPAVLYVWTGSEFVRASVLWGYSDIYAEYEETDNVAVGDKTLTFSTVGAGVVRVVTCFSAWCEQADPARVDLYYYDGTNLLLVSSLPYATAFATVEAATPLYLKEDCYLQVTFRSCLLNNDIRASAFGYTMAVA